MNFERNNLAQSGANTIIGLAEIDSTVLLSNIPYHQTAILQRVHMTIADQSAEVVRRLVTTRLVQSTDGPTRDRRARGSATAH